MTARAVALSFEQRLTARGIAVAGNGMAGCGQRAQISHDDLGLIILNIIGRHRGAWNTILDDTNQALIGGRAAKAAMSEVDAGDQISFRPMTENTIGAEKLSAFLDVAWRKG